MYRDQTATMYNENERTAMARAVYLATVREENAAMYDSHASFRRPQTVPRYDNRDPFLYPRSSPRGPDGLECGFQLGSSWAGSTPRGHEPDAYATLKQAAWRDQIRMPFQKGARSTSSVTSSEMTAQTKESELPLCGCGDGPSRRYRRPPSGSTYWSGGRPMNSRLSEPPGVSNLLAMTPILSPRTTSTNFGPEAELQAEEENGKGMKPSDEPCAGCVIS